MRLWQAVAQANVDAKLELTNLAANSSGWWSLEYLDGAGVATVVGHVPAAGGPVSAGSIPITYNPAWNGTIQNFQWVVVAITPDGSDITPMETMSQGAAALAASDGLGGALPGPPVQVTPDLKNNNKTACPFSIQFP